MSIVSFIAVDKHFGAHDVLSGLNFTIEQSVKAGLIGPNGAGKTTLLRLILGTEEPSRGVVVRSDGLRIGYVPQYPDFPEKCTVLGALTLDLADVRQTLRAAEDRLGTAGEENLEVAPLAIGEYYRVTRFEVPYGILESLLRLDPDLGSLRNSAREQGQGESQAQPKSGQLMLPTSYKSFG